MDDFAHLGADRGPQDVPAGNLQVDRMKDARSATHTQSAQAGFSLEAAIGALDAATDAIAFSKDGRVFFSPSAGQAALLGGMPEDITVTASFDGTFIAKWTLTTC